jgi:hypothetical protein
MKREEKIKMLKAIKDGLLMQKDIRPPKFMVLIEGLNGGWDCHGEFITSDRMKQIEKDIEESSQRRVNCGLSPDVLIKLEYKKGK